MDQDKPTAAPEPTPTSTTKPTGLRLDRRRLLRAGASSAPVLLSLASTPVAAGNCVVASSFVSVATFKSRNPSTTSARCTTYNVEYWRNLSPRPSEMNNSTVGQWLCQTTSSWNGLKLSQVIDQATSTNTELGVAQHLVALSMACFKGYVTGDVNKFYLAGVWGNYKSNGNMYVLPASGIRWDSAKLITWLRYLMYSHTL